MDSIWLKDEWDTTRANMHWPSPQPPGQSQRVQNVLRADESAVYKTKQNKICPLLFHLALPTPVLPLHPDFTGTLLMPQSECSKQQAWKSHSVRQGSSASVLSPSLGCPPIVLWCWIFCFCSLKPCLPCPYKGIHSPTFQQMSTGLCQALSQDWFVNSEWVGSQCSLRRGSPVVAP